MPDLEQKNGIWLRFLIGAIVVIAAAATATSVTGFNEVDKLAKVFGNNPLNLGNDLAQAAPGKPQTMLIIGSDKRARTANDAKRGSGSRSDTMILMRLDPSKGAIALLSLPRDLKVRIPGHGVDKLNASYAAGGTKLTLKTIKLFTGLPINHVINVDFRGFRGAVDAIRCVYTDVDRRYYNDNANPNDQYATIHIEAGYQKLCGKDALDYVRYRHTDTDITRAARQQDFLRQAKAQVGAADLFANQDKLVRIVNRYTRSDIHGRKQVLSLIKLALASAGHPITEIHFPAIVGTSYVTADQAAVHRVAQQFLGVRSSRGPRGPAQPIKPAKPARAHRKSRSKPGAGAGGNGNLLDVGAIGRQQALKLASSVNGLRLYYPKLAVPRSLFSINSPRGYRICGPHGGRCFASYRIFLSRDLLGEYYGLQGTTWMDPPILKSPDQKRTYRGRKLELFYDGDRLRLVAWREKDAVYWVSNTLLQTLSKRQMLDIASTAKHL